MAVEITRRALSVDTYENDALEMDLEFMLNWLIDCLFDLGQWRPCLWTL